MSVATSAPIAALLLFFPDLDDFGQPREHKGHKIAARRPQIGEDWMPNCSRSSLFLVKSQMTLIICILKQAIKVRENHAIARKIFRQSVVSDQNRRAPFRFRVKMEKYIDRKGKTRDGMNLALSKGTMERAFGVKIFRAAVRSRGEVGIVAGKLCSRLFAQTSSLSLLPPAPA
jgi:hypothetical protein